MIEPVSTLHESTDIELKRILDPEEKSDRFTDSWGRDITNVARIVKVGVPKCKKMHRF